MPDEMAPSIAVLFTDERDAGLLRFMANRTVEKSDLDPAGKAAVLQAKFDATDQMRERATARHVCFRSAIVQYFGEERSNRRRPLAVRVVEWIFSRSTRIIRAQGCCDKCDHVQVGNVIGWAARIWGTAEPRAKFVWPGA